MTKRGSGVGGEVHISYPWSFTPSLNGFGSAYCIEAPNVKFKPRSTNNAKDFLPFFFPLNKTEMSHTLVTSNTFLHISLPVISHLSEAKEAN